MEIFDHFRNAIANSERPVVYEFGACDGYHTNQLLNELRKTGKPFVYHAFEPVPELIPKINASCHAHAGLFSVHNYAIGQNKEVGKKFYRSMGNYYGSSSIRQPKVVFDLWTDMQFEETTCDVTTFDDHVKENGLSDSIIDFIWADIQGAELDLILGGKEAFKKVRYFYTEFVNSEFYDGQLFDETELLKILPDFEVIERYYEAWGDGVDNLNDLLLVNKNL